MLKTLDHSRQLLSVHLKKYFKFRLMFGVSAPHCQYNCAVVLQTQEILAIADKRLRVDLNLCIIYAKSRKG